MTIFQMDVQDVKDLAKSGHQTPHESFAVDALKNGWTVKVTKNGDLLATPATAEKLREILRAEGL
jgi:hypothetical protein